MFRALLKKIKSFFNFQENDSFSFSSLNYIFWIACILLILFGIYNSYNVQQYADTLFWDETLYMQKGLQLWQKPELDWGPFYNVWYKLLSLFSKDKIELYYLNIKVLSTLLPLLLFIFLIVNNTNIILAFFVSTLFLFSFMNLPVWPKVSHWCLIIFLATLIISKFIQNIYVKFFVIIFGFALCSFIRPEFYLAYLLFTGFTIIHLLLYRNQYQTKKTSFYFFILIVLYVSVQCIGNPVKAGGNGRMLITFGQHFSYNFCNWNNLKGKPFWIDWVFYLQDNFLGKSKTEVLTIFGQHILSNIITYITEVLKILASFVVPLFHKYLNLHSIIFSILSVLVFLRFSRFLKPTLSTLKSSFQSTSSLQKILLIWCIPTFISSFIAYPRAHYLLLQIPLFIILIVTLIQSVIKTESNYKLFFILTILLFFAKPSAKSLNHFDLLREEKSLCNVTTANYLKAKYTTKEVKVFDFEGNINSILPSNFISNSVDFFTTGATKVSRYIDSSGTDIIYVTPTLINSRFNDKDTTLRNWIAAPENYGYKKIKTGNFDAYLLSRID